MPPVLAPIRLVCLGPPAILVDGRPAPREAQWHKHLALLIYLSLSPRQRRSRDHLVGVFWPENADPRARHALNETVRRLRRALGAGRLRSEGDVLVLDSNNLEVDALRFAAAAETAPEEALSLWGGDFLEGFYLEKAPEFDDWMARERQHYQTVAGAALLAAGERKLVSGRFGEAVAVGRRALTLAPASDRAVSLLMRASALGGEPATALAEYHTFVERLKRETGEPPPAALAALADRIRSQQGSVLKPVDTTAEPPLVGREAIHSAVAESLERGLVSGPRVIVITGAPGMGRTRLLAECVRRASVSGALVLRVRCTEADQDAHWSVLRMLARAGLAEAPGLKGAGPHSLAILAALTPALAERFPAREARDVAEMAAALADAFGAVADTRPLALLIDDAHWADGPSLAALGAAIGSLAAEGAGASARVVLFMTAAEGVGAPARELVRLRGEVGRALPGLVARLDALSQDDIGVLVRKVATWTRDDPERDRLTRRLAVESGGVPFIAATLLAALGKAETLRANVLEWPPREKTFDATLPFSVPSLLRHAVAVQLADLRPEEQSVLAAASICGEPFDLELIAHIAERSLGDVERALPSCEAHRLVQFTGGRYTFLAPVVAEVVRAECLVAGERRRLERRACDALASRADLPSRVVRIGLLARVAPDAAVAEQAIALAQEAGTAGMISAARRALKSAERALSDVSDVALHRRLADLKGQLERSA